MIGRTLKMKLAELARVHNVRPIERPPLPLLAATSKPQIMEGIAASADVDAERMSFARGSLTWSADIARLPLLIRHNSARTAGRILDLRYDADGRLHIRALVDDPEARRMQGFSIAASVWESTIHNPESGCFFCTIEQATIDEISLTPLPANERCLVTSRRDVAPIDDRSNTDAILAALERLKNGIEVYVKSAHRTPPPEQQAPEPSAHLELGAGPAYIYGRLPIAVMKRRQNSFSELVARLPIGENTHEHV